jgi:hypothetical protein
MPEAAQSADPWLDRATGVLRSFSIYFSCLLPQSECARPVERERFPFTEQRDLPPGNGKAIKIAMPGSEPVRAAHSAGSQAKEETPTSILAWAGGGSRCLCVPVSRQ